MGVSGNLLSLDIAMVTGMYFCEAWISHFTISHQTFYEKLFSGANFTAGLNPDGFSYIPIYLNPFQTDYCQLEFRFQQVHCVLRFAFVSRSQGAKRIWLNFHIARIFSLCKTCVAPFDYFLIYKSLNENMNWTNVAKTDTREVERHFERQQLLTLSVIKLSSNTNVSDLGFRITRSKEAIVTWKTSCCQSLSSFSNVISFEQHKYISLHLHCTGTVAENLTKQQPKILRR